MKNRKNNPLVSVLMPVYNCEKYIEQAIKSILNQSYENIEIIVVDDGSNDNSNRILKNFANLDNRIKIIEQQKGGIVLALNNALLNARGIYSVRMDADDISHTERIKKLISHITKNTNTVVVGTQGYICDRNGRPVKPLEVETKNDDIQESLLYTRNKKGIIHASTIFRTDLAQSIGGYREQFIHAEDLDFFLRMGELGKIENLNECLYFYRQHPTSISATKSAQQYQNATACIREACKRRKISFTLNDVPEKLEIIDFKQTELDFLLNMASLSTMYNNKITALYNARDVLVLDFKNKIAWKILFKNITPNFLWELLKKISDNLYKFFQK